MSSDKEQIEQTVQVYFDSMYESDFEKVDKAFHPSAMISGNFGGSFSEMTREAFGKFVAAIPAPLGMATLRLDDGTATKGFIVETEGVKDARDISSFGGWRNYIAQAAGEGAPQKGAVA